MNVFSEDIYMDYRLTHERRPSTVISLIISDENLEPDVITQALGVEPNEAWSKGDPIFPNAPPEHRRTHEFGRWELDAPCSPYDTFEEQLEKLITRLEALPPILKEYIATFDAGLLVGYSSGEVSIGFYLSPQIIQRMAALGLSIDFDIYPIEPEDGREYEV
jgi:hypothetical protein